MRIQSVSLSDFRRFDHFQFDCHPKINCIIGENGTGKTTLLEAIWATVSTTSFRTHKIQNLIQSDKKEAKIGLDFEIDGVEQNLTFHLKGQTKEVMHNQTKLTLSNLIGVLLGVVISTEDMDLIEGDPGKRRYFLDLMLSQTDPLYLWHMRRYNKGLKSKNHLLKSKHLKPIPFFEEEMSKSGAYIAERRFSLIHALAQDAIPFLHHICLRQCALRFEIPTWTPEELKSKWLKERTSEARLGYTLSGPHRDDLKIYLDEKEAKHFASMGEKKSLAMSLKLAQCQLIKKLSNTEPFLLVDDYSSHLDGSRQENFFTLLASQGQVFLTNPSSLNYIYEGQLIQLSPKAALV